MLMMLARFFISGPAIAKLKTVDNARLFKQFDRAIYGCDGNCVIFFNGAAIELIENGRFGPYLQYEKEKEELETKKKKGRKKKNENEHLKNVSIPKGIDVDSVDLDKAKYLCSLPKVLGQHPENKQDITLNSGRFGPYLKCENKSARLENVEDLFSIGINRAIISKTRI